MISDADAGFFSVSAKRFTDFDEKRFMSVRPYAARSEKVEGLSFERHRTSIFHRNLTVCTAVISTKYHRILSDIC